MRERSPHFLLFSEAGHDVPRAYRWRFVLQSVGGRQYLAADDVEPGTRTDRLELLAVVRGLEALDQPSRVTLVTRSRYVSRGIRRDLSQWRARRWRWEHFGELVPIRDSDLWQRVDRALKIHDVDCCAWPEGAFDETLGEGEDLADNPGADRPDPTAPDSYEREFDSRGAETKPPVEQAAPVELAACSRLAPGHVGGVERSARPAPLNRRKTAAKGWSPLRSVAHWRQHVWGSFVHFWRPAFTRAA